MAAFLGFSIVLIQQRHCTFHRHFIFITAASFSIQVTPQQQQQSKNAKAIQPRSQASYSRNKPRKVFVPAHFNNNTDIDTEYVPFRDKNMYFDKIKIFLFDNSSQTQSILFYNEYKKATCRRSKKRKKFLLQKEKLQRNFSYLHTLLR